jgi:hypothetical protein
MVRKKQVHFRQKVNRKSKESVVLQYTPLKGVYFRDSLPEYIAILDLVSQAFVTPYCTSYFHIYAIHSQSARKVKIYKYNVISMLVGRKGDWCSGLFLLNELFNV